MIHRIVTSVFPSMDDDVITSPYNTVLGLKHINEFADCVLPVDNLALARITERMKEFESAKNAKQKGLPDWSCANHLGKSHKDKGKAFDEMNSIVAGMLLSLTR